MYDSNEPSAPNLADREQNCSDKQRVSSNDEARQPHSDAPSQTTTTMRPNSRSNSSVRSDDSLSFGEEMGSDSSDGMVTEMETSPGESGTFVKLQLNHPKSQKERQKSVSRESLTDDSREFDLLSIWESLLDWSENTSVIKQLQEEIDVLKGSLVRLGTEAFSFDSEESVERAIHDLEQERARLQYYRSKMLKINAAVQRWITRQETRMASERRQGIENADLTLADDRQYHARLKDDVEEMYRVWDATEERLSTRLESLEASLKTWRQFESELHDLKETLDKDRGAIFGFKGALEAGAADPSEFVSNAEAVAKLLRDNADSDLRDLLEEGMLPPEVLQYCMRPASAGCSSDSGISDDGGLSERERRLGYLRRLAKQLEQALAGSKALKMITERIQTAELELSTLQSTCRELILRTTASHNQFLESMNLNSRQPINVQIPIIAIKGKKGKKKIKKRSPTNTLTSGVEELVDTESFSDDVDAAVATAATPEDPVPSSYWWRFLRYAVPVQLALLALLFASYGLEPTSCDSMNNFQNSFNPQLRYVRGPPPI